MARATRADRGGDEVGAHAAGDERLGAVDDVVVAVAAGRRPDARDVGPAAGLGHRERADRVAGEHRAHEPVDLLRRRRWPRGVAARCRR